MRWTKVRLDILLVKCFLSVERSWLLIDISWQNREYTPLLHNGNIYTTRLLHHVLSTNENVPLYKASYRHSILQTFASSFSHTRDAQPGGTILDTWEIGYLWAKISIHVIGTCNFPKWRREITESPQQTWLVCGMCVGFGFISAIGGRASTNVDVPIPIHQTYLLM